MSKTQPVVIRWRNTIIRKERPYDVLSIQRYIEDILGKRKKERNTCGYWGACMSKDDSRKGRGFNESIEAKTKQNKTNKSKHSTRERTPEKDTMASANQTPRGYKFAPLVVSQHRRANQHEPACFGLSSS